MPKAKGERRRADVIGNAVKVMRKVTGEETEDLPADKKNRAAVDLDRKRGAQAVRLITVVEEQERGRSCRR